MTSNSNTGLAGRNINRRRLIQGAAATGLSVPAFAGLLGHNAYFASAQDAEAGLVTISQDQQQTWTRNFNPFLPESGGCRWPTHSGVHETLMIRNLYSGEVMPWLATEATFNEDNTVLTVKLREGINWSDGEAFTAEDVAFTFMLFKSTPGLVSPSGITAAFGDDAYLDTVEAVDDLTVAFNFARVFTPGFYDIMHQPIAAEHVWSQVADPLTETMENPVGTGPFTNVTRFEAQYWQLEKNENYWQEGAPKIQGFRFPAYASNDQANLATINGENDWAANFIPEIESTFVARDPEHNHFWYPNVGAIVHLYTQTTKAPWDNVDVRKAVSMALNRDMLTEIGMMGYTVPADGTGMSGAFDSWKDAAAVAEGATWVTYDPDGANALLDAAGFAKDGDWRNLPDGTPMEYEINVVTGWSDWVSVCEIMAQNLGDIGIKATVQTYDFPVWLERVQQGNFDLSIGWSSQGATPFNYYRGVMSSLILFPVGQVASENWQRFVAEGADDLLNEFAVNSDQAELTRISNELQMLFATSVPAIPLFPGPQWGQANTTRFTGFPSADDPYAVLSTYQHPDRLLVMTRIEPVAAE
ncbi:MAG: ABC transporter substrate-binding protein [Thermomicrobiales bacterium]|nr:ABC transporter substrate-binding protein [Thermomicrobiales bacterium]